MRTWLLIAMLTLATGPDSKELAKQGYSLFKDVLAGDEAKLPEAIRQMEEARKADETYVPNLYNLARAMAFHGAILAQMSGGKDMAMFMRGPRN